MRIFFMADAGMRLMEPLASHFATVCKDDVVFAINKQRQNPSLPNVRRILMNFCASVWHGNTRKLDLLWKEIIRNANSGRRIMAGLASTWWPNIIISSSCYGGSFFIRDIFPDVFMASFASLSGNEGEYKVAHRLDSLLFLESQLRFAPDEKIRENFPALLKSGIELEPLYVDTEFFTQEIASPFSCWKFSGSQYPAILFNLQGISEDEYGKWLLAVYEILKDKIGMSIIIVVDKGGMYGKWMGALNRLDDSYRKRIYLTDYLTREERRSAYMTAEKVIVASPLHKTEILECACCGGNVASIYDHFFDDLDVAFHLDESGLAASISKMPEKSAEDINSNREKVISYFFNEQPIGTLAQRILEEYRKWKQKQMRSVKNDERSDQ